MYDKYLINPYQVKESIKEWVSSLPELRTQDSRSMEKSSLIFPPYAVSVKVKSQFLVRKENVTFTHKSPWLMLLRIFTQEKDFLSPLSPVTEMCLLLLVLLFWMCKHSFNVIFDWQLTPAQLSHDAIVLCMQILVSWNNHIKPIYMKACSN